MLTADDLAVFVQELQFVLQGDVFGIELSFMQVLFEEACEPAGFLNQGQSGTRVCRRR